MSGHLGRGESNATFWLFNHRLWLGAALALVGAGLFAAGLSAIFATLNILFALQLPPHWQEHVLTVSLCFVAPVSFLAFAPRSFTDPITAREEGDFTMRAACGAREIRARPFAPRLHRDPLRLRHQDRDSPGSCPRARSAAWSSAICWSAPRRCCVGYPSRETGGPLVRLFWRYWVELAALPVVLLFIAVGRRIADYGVTEQRYLMVLVGVWALILAVPPPHARPRISTSASCRACSRSSCSPRHSGRGGAIGFSIMSQKEQLAELLTEKGMLVDGKIVPRGEGAAESPLGTDAWRARSIEWYLNTHRALYLLAPWFAGSPNDPFAPGKKPEETARELLACARAPRRRARTHRAWSISPIIPTCRR